MPTRFLDVVVLEIISGKKSNSFYQSDNGEYLLSYVGSNSILFLYILHTIGATFVMRINQNDVRHRLGDFGRMERR